MKSLQQTFKQHHLTTCTMCLDVFIRLDSETSAKGCWSNPQFEENFTSYCSDDERARARWDFVFGFHLCPGHRSIFSLHEMGTMVQAAVKKLPSMDPQTVVEMQLLTFLGLLAAEIELKLPKMAETEAAGDEYVIVFE
jgi:hypothetical protein